MRRQIPCPRCAGKGTVEEVVPPPIPPGFQEVSVTSEYYGSHPEYGEGDSKFRVAVPGVEPIPQVKVSHGHSSREWSDFRKFPPSAFIVEEGDEEWIPIPSFLADYEIGEEG